MAEAMRQKTSALKLEEWNELNDKLWEIFRHYAENSPGDYNYSQATAQAALGIIQLQDLKPEG